MCDETPEERQNNEMVALQAIYCDAVTDNRRKAVWNEFRPLDVSITLYPLHSSEGSHCSATVQFKCCHSYPDKPPVISINKTHGLSNDNVTKLLGELEKMAVELCGEVMIFQLAQHVQQFLHEHNKPTLSCYEEMVQQQTEMEKLKTHQLQEKENEERQKMKDEIQRRQEALKSGGRRVRLSSVPQEISPDDGHGDAPKLLYYADDKLSPAKKILRSRSADVPCTCDSKGRQVFRYTRNNKKVYVGNCIGHSPNGSTTYLAIDDDGHQIICKKWILPPVSDFQTRNRQLNSLQQDLKAICRLKHPNLVPYIDMQLSKDTNRRGEQTMYLLRDFVLGVSLKYIHNKCRIFGDKLEALRMLRHVGIAVFSALSELHSVGVLHRDVRSENVFMEDGGGVKLVGASLDSRLCEIIDGDSYCDRQTKVQDVYAAAQVLLSIVSKETSQEIPPDLPSHAKDFFSRCLTEEEQCQWSAEQLIQHRFLTDAPSKSPNNRDKENGESESEDEDNVKRIHTINTIENGHSRLNMEFEVLAWLGKGAFGNVLKVRNKLDGGLYAIKHVSLNPKSVELNKKITREVKLLSRLNHENVVRYYNAWIETITETEVGDSSVMEESSDVISAPMKNGDSLADVVAKLGQEVKVNWSMSDGPVQIRDESSSESEEESESDFEPNSWFNIMKPEDDSSSNIEFEMDSNKSLSIPTEDAPAARAQTRQALYIQMQYCEKRTLRQAIDNGLHREHFRAWRLFREVLEGLAHVHQKGMIHRDLKPVNIFLDSNDHVKIGDFGLATKVFTGLPVDDKPKSQEEIDGLLTGKVGTALYVAPELQQSTTKVIYNQKVDIYSLGIILFEMFHAPFETGTERYTVLTNLRDKSVIMPKDFVRGDNSKQIHVIRWLLDHDASLRPTSAELLSSEHVPRAVPEGALASLLSHTLSERGSRGYQRLVAGCLDQQISKAEDFTFHSGIKPKPMETIAAIQDCIIKVFRSHGATEFSPPLLTPRCTRWEQCSNAVKVMTSSGSVCHLPHDLRLPFARHTAYSGTKYMRRYVIDRVYRETERTVKGFHPREMIECAFDIVTPKTRDDSLWPDAELLVVASRAAAECSLKVKIQINHTDLLRTLLVSCGVPMDKHAMIYPVLVDVSLGRITSLQLQTHLTTLCVSANDMARLVTLLEAEVQISEVQELAAYARRERPPHRLDALHALRALYHNAHALGCDCPITVAPFLAYNATQHSGVFWQMSVVRNAERAAKHRSRDLIAAGGRYDALVEEFWNVARAEKDDAAELKCSSVGFSMSLERMAAILKSLDVKLPIGERGLDSQLISVSVWGTAGDTRDGVDAKRCGQLARELWASGYSCSVWPFSSNVDPHELTNASIYLLHDDAYVLVCCWEGTRFREHKVPFIDVVDFIKQKLSPDTVRCPEFGSRSMSWVESEKSNCLNTSITFITANERMTKNSKRHCEVQISAQLAATLSALGLQAQLARVRVHVLALSCDAAAVRALAAQLAAPLHAHSLPRAFCAVADSFFKRQDVLDDALKELTNMAKQSNQNRNPEETQLYALYSIPDSLCRLIT